MTDKKLIKCHNLPWKSGSGKPDKRYLWVPKDWTYGKLYGEFCEVAYIENETSLGFADWLMEEKGVENAVAEEWPENPL